MKHLFAIGLALALTTGIVVGQDTLDPDMHPWAKYGEGSWVKMKMVTAMGAMGTQEGTMQQTLKSKGDGEYTTLTKTSMMGQENEQEETETLPTSAGTETLEIGGESYECTIWETTEDDGSTGTKVWMTDEGKALQFEGDGMKATAVKVRQEINVGGESYMCVVLEGKMENQGMAGTVKMWLTDNVPGGFIKMEMEMEMGEMGKMTTTIEMEEYEAK